MDAFGQWSSLQKSIFRRTPKTPYPTKVGKRSDPECETTAGGGMALGARSRTQEQGSHPQHHAHLVQLGDEVGIDRFGQDEPDEASPCGRFVQAFTAAENFDSQGVSIAAGTVGRTNSHNVYCCGVSRTPRKRTRWPAVGRF